jgi:hypothetical protein
MSLENELLRLRASLEAAGVTQAAKVMQMAATRIAESHKQSRALAAAHKLLTEIETGRCHDPSYEAGTWLRIYGKP